MSVIYALLIGFNVAAWGAAFMLFHDRPASLAAAFIAYGLGLRHAVDADHIAAIDSATRKLMHEGSYAADAGLFFSLGHCTVVIMLTVAIMIATSVMHTFVPAVADVGAAVGTTVSFMFLLTLGIANLIVFASIWRSYKRLQNSGVYEEMDPPILRASGLFGRSFRKLFRLVSRSWHMYPIGVLFGLGFDTATAVGLLVLSVTSAQDGLGLWSITVYPALFTAAMCLVDTTDSWVMCRAYRWALMDPRRRLVYNLIITGLSATVALTVSVIQAASLFGKEIDVAGRLARGLNLPTDRFGDLFGYSIIAVFLFCWAASVLVYRSRKLQRDQAVRSWSPN